MISRSLMIGSAIALCVIMPAVAGERFHDNELTATKGDKRLLIQDNAGANSFAVDNQNVTASSSLTVPATNTGIIVATFTAESNCTGTAGGWCGIQIFCDGTELFPQVGTDFAFDSVGAASSGSNFHSLSVTRRSDPFTGGTHSCSVQERLVNGATQFRLDDWTFQFEFWRQ
jgi:hypothetical protein